MRAAVLAPMPGSCSSSAALAVLMLTIAEGFAAGADGLCPASAWASGCAAKAAITTSADRNVRTIGSSWVTRLMRTLGAHGHSDEWEVGPRVKWCAAARVARYGGKRRTSARDVNANLQLIEPRVPAAASLYRWCGGAFSRDQNDACGCGQGLDLMKSRGTGVGVRGGGYGRRKIE